MKKFIVALTTLGLISAMSVATFADNFANFNDAQPMQNFTSDINKLYTSNLNKVSSNVVNDLDIKDSYFLVIMDMYIIWIIQKWIYRP